MQERTNPGNLREVFLSFSQLLRNEFRLAAIEAKQNAKEFGREIGLIAVFAGIAFFGALSLLAFLVIGLGTLLGGNYWLSALIIGAVFIAVGIGVAYASIKRIPKSTQFPITTQNVSDDVALVNRKLISLRTQLKPAGRMHG